MTSAALKTVKSEKSSILRFPTAKPLAGEERALLLEDEDFDAAMTTELLENCCKSKFEVTRAKSLREALDLLSREDFAIAILDMNVPDSKGLETVKEVLISHTNIPLLILTGNDDIDIAMEALELGVQDYVPKTQLDSRTLQRAVPYSIQRKSKEQELNAKAYYDCLTGVGNRALLYERWRRTLARCKRANRKAGVLIADMNEFKKINDTYGHAAGDSLLQHFSNELIAGTRISDTVARLGGDEFVIVLEEVHSIDDVNAVRDTLEFVTDGEFHFNGRAVPYSASIGGAISDPRDEEDLMGVLRRADEEMYLHKAEARRKLSPVS